jgi:hypothetical protein
MTQIIKVYDDPKKAQAALSELKAASFANAEIRDGNTVAVDPPYGKGGQAEAILRRIGPSRDVSAGFGRATNSSSHWTGAPRSPDSRTTLGGIFPELTRPDFFLTSMFGPLLTASQDAFSSLSASQKPWSSLASNQNPMSQLASNQNGSARLINDPTPFSNMLGLPVLLRH